MLLLCIMTLRVLAWSSILLCAVSSVAAKAVVQETFIVSRDESSQPVANETENQINKTEPLEAPGWAEKRRGSFCEDLPPEGTGFEIFTNEGFIGHASCTELAGKCHGWINSTRVQLACPVSCFLCDPTQQHYHQGPPCYDAIVTGVKFKQGPTASCSDLANYCNHSTLFQHVQAACRLTCGLCEAHIGHVEGACRDLDSHDEPEFMMSGMLSSCTDLMDFCQPGPNNPQANLVRHKCPRTCGACPELTSTTHSSFQTSNEMSFNSGEEPSDCDRRRRWGFCSTRRRRNL